MITRSAAVIGTLLCCLVPGLAEAASASLILSFTSPPSTAVNCTINYPSGQTSFVTPVAAGTQVASCSIVPSSWQGVVALDGADGALFAMFGMNIVIGSNPITVARTYNISVTATP